MATIEAQRRGDEGQLDGDPRAFEQQRPGGKNGIELELVIHEQGPARPSSTWSHAVSSKELIV
jgi:hypothetical protein